MMTIITNLNRFIISTIILYFLISPNGMTVITLEQQNATLITSVIFVFPEERIFCSLFTECHSDVFET
jgi:hypothetical protein